MSEYSIGLILLVSFILLCMFNVCSLPFGKEMKINFITLPLWLIVILLMISFIVNPSVSKPYD